MIVSISLAEFDHPEQLLVKIMDSFMESRQRANPGVLELRLEDIVSKEGKMRTSKRSIAPPPGGKEPVNNF